MTLAGNKQLVAYGIQNEQSDLRAHVCVAAQVIYVYPTRNGKACAESGMYRPVPVRTNGIETARGCLVPPSAIRDCFRVDIPGELLKTHTILESDSTTTKGEKAVAIVTAMIADALFPFPLQSSIITDMKLQHEGLDVVVAVNVRIQVKCDYRGGERTIGGTGNLFLQTAECNPYRRY